MGFVLMFDVVVELTVELEVVSVAGTTTDVSSLGVGYWCKNGCNIAEHGDGGRGESMRVADSQFGIVAEKDIGAGLATGVGNMPELDATVDVGIDTGVDL